MVSIIGVLLLFANIGHASNQIRITGDGASSLMDILTRSEAAFNGIRGSVNSVRLSHTPHAFIYAQGSFKDTLRISVIAATQIGPWRPVVVA